MTGRSLHCLLRLSSYVSSFVNVLSCVTFACPGALLLSIAAGGSSNRRVILHNLYLASSNIRKCNQYQVRSCEIYSRTLVLVGQRKNVILNTVFHMALEAGRLTKDDQKVYCKTYAVDFCIDQYCGVLGLNLRTGSQCCLRCLIRLFLRSAGRNHTEFGAGWLTGCY